MKLSRWLPAITVAACCAVTPASTWARPFAQDRDDRHDRGDRHDRDRHEDRDERRHDRDERREHRFNEDERREAREWHKHHHDHPPAGFRREDKLGDEDDDRIREGFLIDRDLRRRVYPLPDDLFRRLPPPPRGYRYYVIGGHVVEVDGGWHIADVIHIDLRF
jgi:Ni/Co efflux regulator RcnB